MKKTIWFGLVISLAVPLLNAYAQTPNGPVAEPQAAAGSNLSPGAAEVARLAGSGVGDDVVLAYIRNSQAPFNLTADNILYLKDVGLSQPVTSAMLSHDSTLRSQPQQYAPAPAAAVAPAPVATAPAAPVMSAPPAAAPMAPALAPPPGAPAPAYVTSPPPDVTYFYNDLAPYGTWVYLDGYGWCWQPRTVVVSPGWRPYCDGGNWVYSDAGWYWQSTYSWGWAPFHYGRWYAHPHCGWVWLPDRVWGPAWVTWRSGGDCCGWAPLPPHATFAVGVGWRFNGVSVGVNCDFGLGIGAFAFVSFGNFCSHDIGHCCMPPAQVNTVYHQTTIINNYTVVNNTIVHKGIPVERVSAVSRTPVPRATIHDMPAGGAHVAGRPGSVVYRQQPHAPARPVNMVAQRVDAQHPTIQHTPIAPAATGRPSGYGSTASAPASAPHQPGTQAPRTSTWSSGATTPSSSQHQAPPRGYQPTSTAPAGGARARTTSDWTSSTKPASSTQYQTAPKTYQPATSTTSPTATAPRAAEEWKQGTRVMPSYRSDTGLSAYNSRSTGQSTPKEEQASVEGKNASQYLP